MRAVAHVSIACNSVAVYFRKAIKLAFKAFTTLLMLIVINLD